MEDKGVKGVIFIQELRHNSYQQHALKGQKLLAQGSALGIRQSAMRPVRAKALK